MTDQAAALRKMVRQRPSPAHVRRSHCEIFAITSGKGGVGKSNITMNLSAALALSGARVLIIDADIGTANIDILLNLDLRFHLGHVAQGKATLFQILHKVMHNLYLLPGASGTAGLGAFPTSRAEQLRSDLQRIEEMFDYLMVDTNAGISRRIINLLRGADRVLLVCSGEPTSIVDAYALCKVLYRKEADICVELIANNVEGKKEARDVYGKLKAAVKHFLKKELHYLSYIKHDEGIAHGVINQKPLMMTGATGGAVDNFQSLAAKLVHPPDWARGKGIHQLFDFLLQE